MNTKVLLVFVVILLLFVYLRFHCRVSSSFKILQMSVSELTPEILQRKYPIVLEEQIVEPSSIANTVFKFMYIYKKPTTLKNNVGVATNKAAYLIIFNNTNEKVTISIAHPTSKKTSSESFVDVILYEHMCIILPQKWFYQTSHDVQGIALHNVVSLFL